MFGLVVSSASGLLLFYGQPMRYYGKALFWTKMVLMLLAGVNALYFHLTTYRSVAKWDRDPMLPFGCRVAGVRVARALDGRHRLRTTDGVQLVYVRVGEPK